MQIIEWTKIKMIGWNRYEGNSQDFGPYTIEKEDNRSYSIWWGGVDIGEARSIPEAKALAQSHARGLDKTSTNRTQNEHI